MVAKFLPSVGVAVVLHRFSGNRAETRKAAFARVPRCSGILWYSGISIVDSPVAASKSNAQLTEQVPADMFSWRTHGTGSIRAAAQKSHIYRKIPKATPYKKLSVLTVVDTVK